MKQIFYDTVVAHTAPLRYLIELVGHEQVVFCSDKQSGLRAIIGIYSTALGPALGGTRFYPYANEEAALHDVVEGLTVHGVL